MRDIKFSQWKDITLVNMHKGWFVKVWAGEWKCFNGREGRGVCLGSQDGELRSH